jgi:hypothetical protein
MESLKEIAARVVHSSAQTTALDMSEKQTLPCELVKCAQCKDTGWVGDPVMRCPCVRERIFPLRPTRALPEFLTRGLP